MLAGPPRLLLAKIPMAMGADIVFTLTICIGTCFNLPIATGVCFDVVSEVG